MAKTDQDALEPQTCSLHALRTGNRIEVWSHGSLRYSGWVEELAPKLGVVWIRETRTGERKLISTEEHSIRLS